MNASKSMKSVLIAAATTFAVSCEERTPVSRADAARTCDAPGVRAVVERFGERLKRVSLQAPESVVVREIRRAYAPFITSSLLEAWISEPTRAPGRKVSSPWPERIEVDSIATAANGSCRVQGEVIYVTSAELTGGGSASREPVTVWVTPGDERRISGYEVAASRPSDSTEAGTEAAADVVRRYYAAINARDFRQAYLLWSNNGAASGQTFQEFAAGFDRTARVRLEIGEPSGVEPAAGSRYVEVPVVIRAVTTSGEEQRFKGKYVLRRSVVDGASAEERRWRIYSADVARSR